MNKKTVVIIFLIGLVFSIGLLAESAAMCWEEFRVRVLWCFETFPDGSAAGDTCLHGAIIGYRDCLEHATYNQEDILYGAKILSVTFTRAKRQPVKETETFTVPADGAYFINISNGVRTSSNKTQVSSAEIILDDTTTILRPNELNKNVLFKAIPVNLTAGEHNLSIELKSTPGSFITIVISDRDMTGNMN